MRVCASSELRLTGRDPMKKQFKKITQDGCQNSLFSMALMFFAKSLHPVSWCLNSHQNAICFIDHLWFDFSLSGKQEKTTILIDLCDITASGFLVLV